MMRSLFILALLVASASAVGATAIDVDMPMLEMERKFSALTIGLYTFGSLPITFSICGLVLNPISLLLIAFFTPSDKVTEICLYLLVSECIAFGTALILIQGVVYFNLLDADIAFETIFLSTFSLSNAFIFGRHLLMKAFREIKSGGN